MKTLQCDPYSKGHRPNREQQKKNSQHVHAFSPFQHEMLAKANVNPYALYYKKDKVSN